MSQKDDTPLSCARFVFPASRRFRYRSLLKLNCIINASRTISDGLYGNLRPRERPWKFEKGLTNTSPYPRRSTPIRPLAFRFPSLFSYFQSLSPYCALQAEGFIQLIL